jgi:hypothetical protein
MTRNLTFRAHFRVAFKKIKELSKGTLTQCMDFATW